MSDSFFGKLKNKVSFKLNEAVDDPEAKKYAEEKSKEEKKITLPVPVKTDMDIIMTFVAENKEVLTTDLFPKIKEYIERFSKRPNTSQPAVDVERNRLDLILMKEILRSQSVNELYWKVEDEIEQSENKTPDQFNPRNIPKQMWRNVKRYFPVVIFPVIAILLASLVANEMIIYPPMIRFIFFAFTLIASLLSRTILTLLVVYYMGKRAYDYYINEMSDGPKRLIMPTLFAILPLTTHEYSNGFLNGLARPFKYGEKYSVYDGKELEDRMNNYQTDLNEAFPYIEAINTKEPFQTRSNKIKNNFEVLHKSVAPPNTVPAVIQPLPNVIQPLPNVIQPLPNVPTVTNKPTTNVPLPPVIQPLSSPPPSVNTTNTSVPPPLFNEPAPSPKEVASAPPLSPPEEVGELEEVDDVDEAELVESVKQNTVPNIVKPNTNTDIVPNTVDSVKQNTVPNIVNPLPNTVKQDTVEPIEPIEPIEPVKQNTLNPLPNTVKAKSLNK